MKQDPNALTKGGMIEYLKENLRIEIKERTGYYGDPDYVEVNLFLGEEMLSNDSFRVGQ